MAPLAVAERAIEVDVPVGAPFDAAELRSALAVRLAPDGARVELRVAVAAQGIVHVTAGERARDVDVGGLHGEAAARLVALAASDLMLDDLAEVPAPPARAPREARMTLGALGLVSSWPAPLAGGAADIAIPSGGAVVAIELGGGTLVGANLRVTALTARLAAGVYALDVVELRAGVTLAPIFVAGGADRTLLAGGHVAARLHVPLWARVHAVLAASLDVFATRVEYRVGGMTVLATPRVAPSLSLGFEVAR